MSHPEIAPAQGPPRSLTLHISAQTSIKHTVTVLQKHLFVTAEAGTETAILIGSGKALSKCITIAEIIQRQAREPLDQTQTLARDYDGFKKQRRQHAQARSMDLPDLAELAAEKEDDGRFLPQLTITLSRRPA